jgi:hypothetical protein
LIYEATALLSFFLVFFLGLFLYGYWTVCHKTAQDGISSQDWGLGVQRLLFVVNESDDSQYSKILAYGKDIDASQRETKNDHTSVGLSTWRRVSWSRQRLTDMLACLQAFHSQGIRKHHRRQSH